MQNIKGSSLLEVLISLSLLSIGLAGANVLLCYEFNHVAKIRKLHDSLQTTWNATEQKYV